MKDDLFELRDQQKTLFSTGGGPSESLSLMYSNLLSKYEARKEECDKLTRANTETLTQAEHYQDQLNQYKSSYENMLNERNKYKQQCTQVTVNFHVMTSYLILALFVGHTTMGPGPGREKQNEG